MGKWPLLVLDETLAAVSDEYIDRAGAFLSQLAAKTGFSVLLVTHKSAFFESADLGYRASFGADADGARCLKLEREGVRAHGN
jgi:ABC-type branched-subunit amino acid transport system ATPase component